MNQRARNIPILRSILFVPANVERFVARAPESGADAVCLDLEDSVAAADKAKARAAAAGAIDGIAGKTFSLFVRVNGLESGMLEDDLAAVVRHGLDGVVVPKAHSANVLREVDRLLTRLEREQRMEPGSIVLIPLVESAEGLLNAREIAAACDRVAALSLGAEDLGSEVGLERTESSRELDWPRAQLAIAAAAGGIIAIDTPEPDYSDAERLGREARLARTLGFRGKYCIHPGQVETVNRVFSPSREEVAEAEKVVRLLDEEKRTTGRAAVAVNGKMVDTPHYRQAKRLLEWAEAAGISAKE